MPRPSLFFFLVLGALALHIGVCLSAELVINEPAYLQAPALDAKTPPVAYNIPAANGGSQLDSSAGLGEYLNVGIQGIFKTQSRC